MKEGGSSVFVERDYDFLLLFGHTVLLALRLRLLVLDARQDLAPLSRCNVGLFVNYLGIRCGDIDGERAGRERERDFAVVDREGDMRDGRGGFLVSEVSAMAEIPMRHDGDLPRITLTEISYVGRFVAPFSRCRDARWV